MRHPGRIDKYDEPPSLLNETLVTAGGTGEATRAQATGDDAIAELGIEADGS